MEARIKVEEAGSRLGALRRRGSPPEEIMAAELELAEAQFELAVENAVKKHAPSPELVARVCERLKETAAA